MTNPSAGVDPGTVAALIGIVVVVVQILGRVIDKLFALAGKNKNGNSTASLSTTLEKVSERMVDMIITQKDLASNQQQITTALGDLSDRFEKGLNGFGGRIERRLDQFEKHLPL